MKKLVFMFVAVAAISFASCGNKAAQNAEAVDSVAEEVVDTLDSAAVDTLAEVVDSAAAEAVEAVEEAVAE